MTDDRQEPMNLGVLLFVASRSLEERAYRAVVDSGVDDLTVAQARLLSRVGPHGTRLGDLAAQTRVTKQTAGHLVDELARSGYVTREPDPHDGRARLVTLTPRALALVPLAGDEVERALAEWRAHVGDRRMDQLGETMSLLRELVDPSCDRPPDQS